MDCSVHIIQFLPIHVCASDNRFSDDGSGHKAALLSGPPGVGKTTTATLVAQVRSCHEDLLWNFVIISVSNITQDSFICYLGPGIFLC